MSEENSSMDSEDQLSAEGKETVKGAEIQKPKDQENPLINILVNVLIPVVALSFLSKDDGKPWHIGPLWGMIVAVTFPLVYGAHDLIKKRTVNFFSVIGLVSVLLTGGITLYLWNEDGSVKPNADVFFGIKEALMPFILGIVILASHWMAKPLVRVLLYNPDLFDVKRIEKAVARNGETASYDKLLFSTTLIMSASFFLSAVMNYFLALYFLEGITGKAEYNEAVGALMGWGFLVIGLPCLVLWMIAMFRLVKRIRVMTGLELEEVMLPR